MPPAARHGDLFVKIMSALITAAALKISADIGDIKTSVAVAVTRIEQQELRLRELETRVIDK